MRLASDDVRRRMRQAGQEFIAENAELISLLAK